MLLFCFVEKLAKSDKKMPIFHYFPSKLCLFLALRKAGRGIIGKGQFIYS
jgi:hypothetical protein